MTEQEFRRLAAAYGEDLSRWPPDSRAQAARLAKRPELSRVLREAGLTDDLVSAALPKTDEERVAQLIERTMMALPRQDVPPARMRRLGVGFAAANLFAAVIGIYLAFTYPLPGSEPGGSDLLDLVVQLDRIEAESLLP